MRSIGLVVLGLMGFVACNAPPPGGPDEHARTTSEALFALGQPCTTDAQCTTAGTVDATAHCVDAVCCNSACGGGARDNQACSNVYGTVAGLVPGTCKTLTNGSPCGNLEPGTSCRFRPSILTSNACPSASASMQEQACYPCTDSASCPAGRPICDSTGAAATKPLDTYYILDHSGSMGNDCALGSNGTSKWCYATNALASYFESAVATGNRAALQYMSLASSNCATGTPYDVPAVGLTTLPVAANSTLVQNIANAAPVSGFGTEVEAAVRGMVTFTKNNVTAGRIMSGVLITDGDPNGCNGNASQLAQILADHFNATGIRIFIIGMTGASASFLETLAIGGGAPAHTGFCLNGAASCHYYSVGNGDPAAFAAALGAIQQAVGAGCEACSSNNGSGGVNACPSNTAPVCSNGQCVPCSVNGDCQAAAPICSGGACVPCNGDFGTGATHACPTAADPACILAGPGAGSCVPCTSNAQCSGTTPICSAQHTCVACDGNAGSNTPAACPTSTPVCLTAGATSGSCVQCTPTSAGACTGATPVCNPATDTCVGCTDDSQCPSGVCDTSSHTCTAPCTQDSDCAAPKPVCNAGICVACLTSAQCPGDTPVCDPSTHTCTGAPDAGVDGGTDSGVDGGADSGVDGGKPVGTEDAGSGADSGAPAANDAFSLEGGGCACKVTGAPRSGTSGGAPLAFGLALGVAALRSRRRR